jgi:uncharacterized protein with GYD domain
MPTYILLANLTDQAIKAIKIAPRRIDKAIKNFEEMGGKLIAFYTTMGEYDYVIIGEAPSDEVAMAFLLRLGSAGDVRTKTLRAFTKEELAKMLKKLP